MSAQVYYHYKEMVLISYEGASQKNKIVQKQLSKIRN